MANSIEIDGLTPDDKDPGDYNQINYGAGKRSAGSSTVRCNLVGNMLPSVAAAIGAVARSGVATGPLVTTSGTPTGLGYFIVEITTGGSEAAAVFQWSDNGGNTYTTTVTAVGAGVLLSNGVTVVFPSGTYVAGAIYTFTATPAGSPGTAALNTLYDIFTPEQAENYFGAGSELHLMCLAALAVDGVSLRAMAVDIASGASEATCTVTIGGVWDGSGDTGFRVNGMTYRTGVATTDIDEDVADRLADEVNGDSDACCTAEVSGAVITLTFKTPGVRGNGVNVWKVMGQSPTGLTMTLSGGTPLIGGGVPFSGGAGTDDVEDVLEALRAETVPLYDFYAFAQQDSVNLALIESQLDFKAGPLEQQYEQATFAINGTQAAAIALAQITLNHQLSGLLLDEEGEDFPPQLAAQFAAIRSVTEGTNPNPDYDGKVLPTGTPRAEVAKAADPIHSKRKAQLNAGVTPIRTINGKKVIVRAITTKCLTGASPDYRTLDLGEATVPMRLARETSAEWAIFKSVNPTSGPDPDAINGEKAAPAGLGTPSAWQAKLYSLLLSLQARNWIYQVESNPPFAYWDATAERIMSSTPCKVRPINHQLGNEINQL